MRNTSSINIVDFNFTLFQERNQLLTRRKIFFSMITDFQIKTRIHLNTMTYCKLHEGLHSSAVTGYFLPLHGGVNRFEGCHLLVLNHFQNQSLHIVRAEAANSLYEKLRSNQTVFSCTIINTNELQHQFYPIVYRNRSSSVHAPSNHCLINICLNNPWLNNKFLDVAYKQMTPKIK
ncbi:hypothetical protein AGLY_013690 [Aphis glycines]|uniref:Uncharacterized protein n=1 Tax=Aphis glycines TaxID=307491 RepID=A0A6G0T8B9_APHGL|nr:hypothetical protein AGLY_013690 [Aphis glycines]